MRLWALTPGPPCAPSMDFNGQLGLRHLEFLVAWDGLEWGRRCTSDTIILFYLFDCEETTMAFQVLSFPLFTQTPERLGCIFQPLLVSHQQIKHASTTTLYSVIKCTPFSHTTCSAWHWEDTPPGTTLELQQAKPLGKIVFWGECISGSDRSLIAKAKHPEWSLRE